MAQLVTRPGVELAKVGRHGCLTGAWDCTPQSIADAVAAAGDGQWRAPVIKIGHTDPRFDGQPAVGTIRNVRASADGQTLLGDLVGIPQWLDDILPSAYPSRSVEGVANEVSASGQQYKFRLTGLALLGVEPPAIESLADVAATYGIAAGRDPHPSTGTPIVTVPDVVAAAADKPHGDVAYADPGYQADKVKRYPIDSSAHVRAAWSYISQDSNASKYTAAQVQTIKTRIKAAAKRLGVQIVAAAAAPTTTKGAGMDPAKLREALGLPADASNEDVAAALVAGMTAFPPATEPVSPPAPAPALPPAPVPVVEVAPPLADAPPAVPVEPVADPILAELRSTVAQLRSELDARNAADLSTEVEGFLSEAVNAGAMRPSEKDHYKTLYAANPTVTREVVMARRGTVPLVEVGHAGSLEGSLGDDKLDAALAFLTGKDAL